MVAYKQFWLMSWLNIMLFYSDLVVLVYFLCVPAIAKAMILLDYLYICCWKCINMKILIMFLVF